MKTFAITLIAAVASAYHPETYSHDVSHEYVHADDRRVHGHYQSEHYSPIHEARQAHHTYYEHEAVPAAHDLRLPVSHEDFRSAVGPLHQDAHETSYRHGVGYYNDYSLHEFMPHHAGGDHAVAFVPEGHWQVSHHEEPAYFHSQVHFDSHHDSHISPEHRWDEPSVSHEYTHAPLSHYDGSAGHQVLTHEGAHDAPVHAQRDYYGHGYGHGYGDHGYGHGYGDHGYGHGYGDHGYGHGYGDHGEGHHGDTWGHDEAHHDSYWAPHAYRVHDTPHYEPYHGYHHFTYSTDHREPHHGDAEEHRTGGGRGYGGDHSLGGGHHEHQDHHTLKYESYHDHHGSPHVHHEVKHHEGAHGDDHGTGSHQKPVHHESVLHHDAPVHHDKPLHQEGAPHHTEYAAPVHDAPGHHEAQHSVVAHHQAHFSHDAPVHEVASHDVHTGKHEPKKNWYDESSRHEPVHEEHRHGYYHYLDSGSSGYLQ